MNVKVISLCFCLQNNKCVCHIANTQNNNNFEIIKVIHNCETVYVCTLYYLKRTFIHNLKNGVGYFSMGRVNKLCDFSLYGFSL